MFNRSCNHRLASLALLASAALACTHASADPSGDPASTRGAIRGVGGADNVSTGNKSLDILLKAQLAPDAAASSSGAAGGGATTPEPAEAATVGRSGATQSGGSAESLRQALIRDAADQLRADTKSDESEQKRHVDRDGQLAAQGRSGIAKTDAGVHDGTEAGSLILPREFVQALRDHRYLILGLASACVFAVWRASVRAQRFRAAGRQRGQASDGTNEHHHHHHHHHRRRRKS